MLAYIVSFCPENLPLALPVWTWSLAVKLTGEPRRQNGTNEGVEESRAVAFQPAVLHGLRGRMGKFSGNNLVEGEHAVSGFCRGTKFYTSCYNKYDSKTLHSLLR